MFSTMPRMGMFIIWAMLTALATIMLTSSWGLATTMMPSTGRLWKTVRGTSPVPGGISTKRKSTSFQTTSVQNCLTAPAMTGAAPDHRVLLVLDQQVDAHDVDAHPALDGPAALAVGHGPAMDAKQLGDGRAGDVGVQDAAAVAAAAHGAGQQGAGHALADAALAGHHADDLFDAAVGVGRLMLGRLLPGRAVRPAAGTIMGAFLAHSLMRPQMVGATLLFNLV